MAVAVETKLRSITFSKDEVRAILAGTKTQFRRPIHPRVNVSPTWTVVKEIDGAFFILPPDGALDDGSYCKITVGSIGRSGDKLRIRATDILLEITNVRVQRLHQISDADVRAEGIEKHHVDKNRPFFHKDDCHALAFAEVWQKRHGKTHPWQSNAWVWAITFKRIPAEASR